MTPPKPRGRIHWVTYLLVLAVTAVVVIVILAVLGPSVGNIFSNIILGI